MYYLIGTIIFVSIISIIRIILIKQDEKRRIEEQNQFIKIQMETYKQIEKKMSRE